MIDPPDEPPTPARDLGGRERLVLHAPLRSWSPHTAAERRDARRFLARVLRFPYLTASVVAVLAWFYLAQLIFGWPLIFGLPSDLPLQDELLMEAVGARLGWLDGDAVRRGEWFRLVSATLLHGSVLHLLGNCFVLYFLGRIVENVHGRAAWLVAYVGGGAAGGLLSMTLSGHHSLGASGAILGLLGVVLVYGLRHRASIPAALEDSFRLDMWFFVLFVGLLSLMPAVDWAGHLGGFAFGALVGALWPPQSEAPAGFARRSLAPALGTLAAAAFLVSTGVVGQRVWQMSQWMPAHEIRALRDALDDGDLEQAEALARGLANTLPDSDSLQYLRVGVLLAAKRPDEALTLLEQMASDQVGLIPLRIDAAFLAGRPESAVTALRDQERRATREFRRGGQGDNALAWALFLARPAQRKAVEEGLGRVRRALQVRPDERAYRNTLALGLVLSGDGERARVLIDELMAGRPRVEQKDDVFIKVMALQQLGQGAAAAALYADFASEFPDAALRVEAETRLRSKGLISP